VGAARVSGLQAIHVGGVGAEDVAGALNRAVLKVQNRPDDTDRRVFKECEHRLDGVGGDDLGVVVEEKHELAARVGDTDVVLHSEVEGLVVVDDHQSVATDPSELGAHLGRRRCVGDDDELELLVGRLLEQGLNGVHDERHRIAAQVGAAAAGRDDY